MSQVAQKVILGTPQTPAALLLHRDDLRLQRRMAYAEEDTLCLPAGTIPALLSSFPRRRNPGAGLAGRKPPDLFQESFSTPFHPPLFGG